MRTFLVYTLARLGLFLVVYGLLWLALSSRVTWDSVSALYTAMIAMVVSSLLAFVGLRRQREALAAQIAERSASAVSAQRRGEQAGEDSDGVHQLDQPGVSKDGDQR